nr:hypothetical protein [Anaerolineae bacterium]
MNQDVSKNKPTAHRRTPCVVLRHFFSHYGQSMLEMAILLPALILLIAGMVEVGAYAVSYLTLLDATREAARFGASLDPELTSQHPFDMRDGPDADTLPDNPFPDVRTMTPDQLLDVCMHGETTNFYYEVACLTFQNMPTGTLRLEEGDDIVITVIGTKDGQIAHRWPLTPTHANPNDWGYHFRGANDGDTNPTCTIMHMENCRGWSLYGVRGSLFDNEHVENRLDSDAPATGYVIVEIFHAHYHFTGLFTIGNFIPNPIQMRPYAIFPVSAAEPR